MFIKINKLFIVCMEYVGRKLAKSLEIQQRDGQVILCMR
jgi:hypothetical protein